MSQSHPIDITVRTLEFAARIIKLCRTLGNSDSANRVLASQLLRSGTSIGANVEEAQSGQSKADFTAKIYIACKEARETNYWLRLLVSADVLPADKLESIIDESNQLVAILTTIAKKVNLREFPKTNSNSDAQD